MTLKSQSRSILLHLPVHANLPVAGTETTQGPNSGPVGREGFSAAGSRAKSLRLCRADVALGSSEPGDSAWELKRIEGCPVSESRGHYSEMPEDNMTVNEVIAQIGTRLMGEHMLQLSHRAHSNKWNRVGCKAATPSGSGSRNGMGEAPPANSVCLCHRSLTASGPTKFMGLESGIAMVANQAHRIWGACG